MKLIIGRPINGISLNGLEYLLDENGNQMSFSDEAAARQYLEKNGVSATDLDGFTFEERGE